MNCNGLKPTPELYLEWVNNYLSIETMADHYLVEYDVMGALLARSKIMFLAANPNHRTRFTLNNINLHHEAYDKFTNSQFFANRHRDVLIKEFSA